MWTATSCGKEHWQLVTVVIDSQSKLFRRDRLLRFYMYYPCSDHFMNYWMIKLMLTFGLKIRVWQQNNEFSIIFHSQINILQAVKITFQWQWKKKKFWSLCYDLWFIIISTYSQLPIWLPVLLSMDSLTSRLAYPVIKKLMWNRFLICWWTVWLLWLFRDILIANW